MPGTGLKTMVIDCGSGSAPQLRKIFSEWSSVVGIACAEVGERCPDADLIVLSGGPRFYGSDDTICGDYVDQFAFLDKETRPTLGICMGHQGMGLRNGARLFTGRKRRVEEVIHLTEEANGHPLLGGIESGTRFAERHTEGITLPEGFILLGYSRYYPVEIMAARDRPFYGTQFHPESSGEIGMRLLRNFFDLAARFRSGGRERSWKET